MCVCVSVCLCAVYNFSPTMGFFKPVSDLLFALKGFFNIFCALVFGADVIFCTLWWLGCCNTQISSFSKKRSIRYMLQTASIAITASPPILHAVLNTFCILCIRRTWWWYLPYLAYVNFDSTPSRGGRRSNFFRSLPLWSLSAEYFPASLEKQDAACPFPPDTPYIFCYHPVRFESFFSYYFQDVLLF